MKRIFAGTILIASFTIILISAFAQSESRDDLLKQIETGRAELSALEKSFLAPSEEDRDAYAEFLSEPGTGLIRLLPRDVYDSEVYKKNNKSLTMRGTGAYYSFARLTHEYGYGSDLELAQGHFIVGFAGFDHGMLVNVGDLPLEQISLEHPSVSFLSAYTPPAKEPDARTAIQQSMKGFTVDEVRYQRRVPVEVKSTYILRSIGYRVSDVLVAFKVIRKDTDGSVIILWKLLKKYSVPELARAN
jgi:hypothetical protein